MVGGRSKPQSNPELGHVAALTSAAALVVFLSPAGIAAEWVGGLALILAISSYWLIGEAALGVGIPAIGLLADPTHSPWSLVGWSLAGIVGGLGVALARREWLREQQRDLRQKLRLAERDHRRLSEILTRYPALQNACLALSEVRDTDHLASVLCREVRQLVPTVLRVRVYLGVALQLSCRASIDHDGQPCPREPRADEDYVASEARVLTRHDGDDLRLLLPLRGERRGEHSREALCGVLEATLQPDENDEHLRLELLHTLAQLGGIGLAAVDLVGQARALALRDDLTGLFGQHEFLRRLDEQVASARRHQHPLGVIMCDLDHLKQWNDTWGHTAGDQALIAIANVIRQLTREFPGAIACRYGGEEFAVCLPGRGGIELAALTERLRIDIANLTPDPAHPQRKLTASFGAATLRAPENGRAVLIRADAACYRAKAEGRNRVSLADDLGTVEAITRILPAVERSLFRGQPPS